MFWTKSWMATKTGIASLWRRLMGPCLMKCKIFTKSHILKMKDYWFLGRKLHQNVIVIFVWAAKHDHHPLNHTISDFWMGHFSQTSLVLKSSMKSAYHDPDVQHKIISRDFRGCVWSLLFLRPKIKKNWNIIQKNDQKVN